MTTANALTFIGRGLEDPSLRERLNSATSLAQRDKLLADERLVFSGPNFDDAYHLRLTQCQTVEAADQLKEFKMWWDLLAQILNPASCGQSCSSCG